MRANRTILTVLAVVLLVYGAMNLQRGSTTWSVVPDTGGGAPTVERVPHFDSTGAMELAFGYLQLAAGSVVLLVLHRTRLGRATAVLHLLTALCVGFLIVFAPIVFKLRTRILEWGPGDETGAMLVPTAQAGMVALALLLGFIAAFQVLAVGLRRGKPWAWIGSLIALCSFASSLLLPIVVVGIMGLLAKDVRARFGMEPAPSAAATPTDATPAAMGT